MYDKIFEVKRVKNKNKAQKAKAAHFGLSSVLQNKELNVSLLYTGAFNYIYICSTSSVASNEKRNDLRITFILMLIHVH